ncbi:MAG: amidohydrolase family protein [Actinomycetaceae bacterium]|nr:amidohydrolase family protein [Actinomycetaceae bacterium]
MTTYQGTVFDGFGTVVGHGLEVDGGQLARVIPARADAPSTDIIIPGLIDIHCHGGGGVSFPDTTDPTQIRKAITAHQRGGTTAMFASLVSMADPLPQIRALVPFCEDGSLLGIHLEGPYISVEKKGAQNPAAIRGIDLSELQEWLTAGQRWIKTITIAPENVSEEAIRLLLSHRCRPSWGHTNCTGTQARAALNTTMKVARELGISAVPQTVTHLFNAMPPIGHRTPGPVREFLAGATKGQVDVEIIADGHHIHPDLVEDLFRALGPAHLFFVTDALAAAGLGDGHYVLGGLKVEVRDGACYLEGTDQLSGGASCLIKQVQLFARRGAIPFADIVRATVSTPHRAGGGPLQAPGVTINYVVGQAPSFLVLSPDYQLKQVVRCGAELL